MLCSHLPAWLVHRTSQPSTWCRARPAHRTMKRRLFLFDLEIYRRFLTAAALNLILNGLSLVERHQSGTFDGANVYEHIFATVLRLNESIALSWIEPLHSAGSHAVLPVEPNHDSVVLPMVNSKLFRCTALTVAAYSLGPTCWRVWERSPMPI